ncbi:hypothetical protein [Mycolicibacterium conceptionense]|uniref:hypothetical protein n=1 Tax=Mycolicibacterium conceptionense TaxID=451644 RepID=UPI0032049A15
MGYNHIEDTAWVQAVCDGCGYIEDSYHGMADTYSAVEASELGHCLIDWLWTYGNPIDLCPKCSIECSDCYGEGCEQCGFQGRKAVIGVQSRHDYLPPPTTQVGDGNRLTGTGDTRFGTKPIVDTTNASTIELTEPAGTAEPCLNLMIADARALAGIPGLLTTVKATMTTDQAFEVRARIDTWLARHNSPTPA